MTETLTGVLDARAARGPEREYLRFGGESFTYAEIAENAGRIATALLKMGVQRGDPVAILTAKPRGVLAMYGVMKAGAVAIPLDISSPPARLAATIRDCGAAAIVSEEIFRPSLTAMARLGLRLRVVAGIEPGDLPGAGIPWAEIMATAGGDQGTSTEGDVAYVLYTSGSTGVPKGIAHTHASAAAFAQWTAKEFDITANDRLGNYSALHFDLSTFDLFAAARAGATTVLIPRSAAIFPGDAARLMVAERISVWYSVPFYWTEALRLGALDGLDLSSLRVILFAGERFAPRSLAELMRRIPGARFANLFGPTETNVCVWHEVDAPPDAAVPIGRACPYSEIRIDPDGELLVRGATRMTGYWRNPEATRSALDQEGYYRTGDFVRRDASGTLHFVGRRDRQVKVRGWRLELDEIESALLTLPGVLDGAVWMVEENGESELAAAVVLCESSGQTEEKILAALAQRLASAAVPAHVTVQSALPRTATGKLDRRAIAKGVTA